MTTPLFTLGDAAALLPGATLLGDPGTPISRVHSDTRTLQSGDLFVALRGDNFDAHAFLPQARPAGAARGAGRARHRRCRPGRPAGGRQPGPRCSSWPPAGAAASPAR